MADKLRIKTQFVSAVLKETAQMIYDQQAKTVKEWDLFDSGKLSKSLPGHFSVREASGGGLLTMRYLAYTRFLDMRDPRRKKKKEGYHLYNRIVFGVLYNPTVNTLQYGLTEDIRNAIENQIKEIYDKGMPYYKVSNVALKQMSNHDRNPGTLIAKSMRAGYG